MANDSADNGVPVGVIGLGMMGHPMAVNLLKRGDRPVHITGRGRDRYEDLISAGAVWHDTPRSLADAVRVLLPEVLAHLVEELGSSGRILVGVPERHLLTAGSLRPGDDDFATLFAEFIVEHSGGADEPIDRRVFELVDGRLVEFAGL